MIKFIFSSSSIIVKISNACLYFHSYRKVSIITATELKRQNRGRSYQHETSSTRKLTEWLTSEAKQRTMWRCRRYLWKYAWFLDTQVCGFSVRYCMSSKHIEKISKPQSRITQKYDPKTGTKCNVLLCSDDDTSRFVFNNAEMRFAYD